MSHNFLVGLVKKRAQIGMHQNQNQSRNQNFQNQNRIKTKTQNQNFKTSFGFGACLVEIPGFRTKVYRKLAAQPYILPFHSSHPLHIFKNIPFSAMLRATRICSHAEDLKEEIQKIPIILLLNKYPPNFIGKHTNRFYKTVTGKNGQELLF